MTALALLAPLSLASSTENRWCLVRWSRGKFCGPLSLSDGGPPGSSLGFPGGRVGPILRFATPEEAAGMTAGERSLPDTTDVPTPMDVLRFAAVEHSYYDGSDRILAEGVFEICQLMVYARRGQIAGQRGSNYLRIDLDCAPLEEIKKYKPANVLSIECVRERGQL